MSLYQKSLVAFAVVILVAVFTVAVLVGQRTTTEFRQYAAFYDARTQALASLLVRYYATQGRWEGVQALLTTWRQEAVSRRWGREGDEVGMGGMPGGPPPRMWELRVADAQGRVVADTAAPPGGRLTSEERARAYPLRAGGEVVGYLVVETQAVRRTMLDAPAQRFLTRVREALVMGGLLAFLVAMVLAGLLARGIIAPLHALMEAAQAIAQGNLEARAPVRGHDEVAQLAAAFNQMAASLQRAEQARQAQTADIAHELRNPLAVLQGTLEALADGIYDPTPENIRPALDQVRTLNRLVDDLRTLALADAGRLRLHRQRLDVGTLVGRVAEAHREPLAEKGIALVVEIAPTLPAVFADYERLTQVLNNILGNAACYVPSGGHVRVAVAPEGGGVTVRIVDDGPGVPAEDLPRLFERFWRGEPSRSRATGGTGLGLAIARHVVEAHGGRIWAEETPGGGLTVAFWLPAGEEG